MDNDRTTMEFEWNECATRLGVLIGIGVNLLICIDRQYCLYFVGWHSAAFVEYVYSSSITATGCAPNIYSIHLLKISRPTNSDCMVCGKDRSSRSTQVPEVANCLKK